MVDAYNASHTTQVRVTLIPDEQVVPTFSAAVAAGKPPDIVALDLIDLPAVAAAHDLLDYGVTYLPGMAGGWSSFIGGNTIGIPRGSRPAGAAWSFITWCLSASIQVNQFTRNDSVPVRTDLALNRYTTRDARLATEALATSRGRAPYSLHYDQLFNDPRSPWQAMIAQAVFGGQIDQAITTAQRRFTQIISGSR